jgi:hypothetical protein
MHIKLKCLNTSPSSLTDHVCDTTEEQRRVSGEDERPVYLAMTPRHIYRRLGLVYEYIRTTLAVQFHILNKTGRSAVML